MKTKLFLLVLIPVMLFLFTSCDSDTPIFGPGNELPPETTTGANTFGCLVNGKVWTNGGVPFPYASLGIVEMSDSTLSISATRSVKDTLSGIGIHLWLSNIGVGIYQCDSLTVNVQYSIGIGGPTGYNIWYRYAKEGTVEFTRYDLDARIVSGRFEALLSKTDCEDIIITEGRFDVRQ